MRSVVPTKVSEPILGWDPISMNSREWGPLKMVVQDLISRKFSFIERVKAASALVAQAYEVLTTSTNEKNTKGSSTIIEALKAVFGDTSADRIHALAKTQELKSIFTGLHRLNSADGERDFLIASLSHEIAQIKRFPGGFRGTAAALSETSLPRTSKKAIMHGGGTNTEDSLIPYLTSGALSVAEVMFHNLISHTLAKVAEDGANFFSLIALKAGDIRNCLVALGSVVDSNTRNEALVRNGSDNKWFNLLAEHVSRIASTKTYKEVFKQVNECLDGILTPEAIVYFEEEANAPFLCDLLLKLDSKFSNPQLIENALESWKLQLSKLLEHPDAQAAVATLEKEDHPQAELLRKMLPEGQSVPVETIVVPTQAQITATIFIAPEEKIVNRPASGEPAGQLAKLLDLTQLYYRGHRWKNMLDEFRRNMIENSDISRLPADDFVPAFAELHDAIEICATHKKTQAVKADLLPVEEMLSAVIRHSKGHVAARLTKCRGFGKGLEQNSQRVTSDIPIFSESEESSQSGLSSALHFIATSPVPSARKSVLSCLAQAVRDVRHPDLDFAPKILDGHTERLDNVSRLLWSTTQTKDPEEQTLLLTSLMHLAEVSPRFFELLLSPERALGMVFQRVCRRRIKSGEEVDVRAELTGVATKMKSFVTSLIGSRHEAPQEAYVFHPIAVQLENQGFLKKWDQALANLSDDAALQSMIAGDSFELALSQSGGVRTTIQVPDFPLAQTPAGLFARLQLSLPKHLNEVREACHIIVNDSSSRSILKQLSADQFLPTLVDRLREAVAESLELDMKDLICEAIFHVANQEDRLCPQLHRTMGLTSEGKELFANEPRRINSNARDGLDLLLELCRDNTNELRELPEQIAVMKRLEKIALRLLQTADTQKALDGPMVNALDSIIQCIKICGEEYEIPHTNSQLAVARFLVKLTLAQTEFRVEMLRLFDQAYGREAGTILEEQLAACYPDYPVETVPARFMEGLLQLAIQESDTDAGAFAYLLLLHWQQNEKANFYIHLALERCLPQLESTQIGKFICRRMLENSENGDDINVAGIATSEFSADRPLSPDTTDASLVEWYYQHHQNMQVTPLGIGISPLTKLFGKIGTELEMVQKSIEANDAELRRLMYPASAVELVELCKELRQLSLKCKVLDPVLDSKTTELLTRFTTTFKNHGGSKTVNPLLSLYAVIDMMALPLEYEPKLSQQLLETACMLVAEGKAVTSSRGQVICNNGPQNLLAAIHARGGTLQMYQGMKILKRFLVSNRFEIGKMKSYFETDSEGQAALKVAFTTWGLASDGELREMLLKVALIDVENHGFIVRSLLRVKDGTSQLEESMESYAQTWSNNSNNAENIPLLSRVELFRDAKKRALRDFCVCLLKIGADDDVTNKDIHRLCRVTLVLDADKPDIANFLDEVMLKGSYAEADIILWAFDDVSHFAEDLRDLRKTPPPIVQWAQRCGKLSDLLYLQAPADSPEAAGTYNPFRDL